ncbi:MAG: sigma-70 family RNA polymerase sigma factor [Pirellulaceae bacterium]
MDQDSTNEMPYVSSEDEGTEELRRWLAEARAGSQESMGKLLEVCRGYLLGIANDALESGMRARLGASDLVQETLLEAERGMRRFRGTTHAELLAWVRRILQHNLSDARRHARAEKRHVGREQRMDGLPRGYQTELTAGAETPSALVSEWEDECRLMQAFQELPDDYRRVIELRNWHLLPFARVGEQMGRSEEAARKLWVRAIERLREAMGVNDGRD